MVEIQGTLRYPDGLTPGQSRDGGLSENLYDSQGKLKGHATFSPDDYKEPAGLSDEGVIVLGGIIVVIVGVAYAVPWCKRWWQERHPRLKGLRVRSEDLARSAADDGNRRAATGEIATLSMPALADDCEPTDQAPWRSSGSASGSVGLAC
jgi:hypothetical protein